MKKEHNKLIIAVAKEIDFWLLEKNKDRRIHTYGRPAWCAMQQRMRKLRALILNQLFNDKKTTRTRRSR